MGCILLGEEAAGGAGAARVGKMRFRLMEHGVRRGRRVNLRGWRADEIRLPGLALEAKFLCKTPWLRVMGGNGGCGDSFGG